MNKLNSSGFFKGTVLWPSFPCCLSPRSPRLCCILRFGVWEYVFSPGNFMYGVQGDRGSGGGRRELLFSLLHVGFASGACPQQQKWALDSNFFQPQNPYHQGPLVISAAAKTVPCQRSEFSSTGPCLQSSVSWSPRCFPSFLSFPQSSGWEWLCVCVCLSVCLMSKPWDFLERYLLQKQLSYHC